MGQYTLNIPSKYTTPIGYRKCGKPIYLFAGAEDDPSNPVTVTPTDPTGQGEAVFTQADVDRLIAEKVEAARKQEKDKVYGRIDKLQQDLEAVTTREAERVSVEEQARKDAEEQARLAAEENLSAKDLLAVRETEWKDRFTAAEKSFEEKFAAMQAEREQERALADKEKAFNALQSYKAQRLVDLEDEIAPQFHVFINGNTEQEIDASIEVAKAQSAEVMAQVQAAVQAQRQQTRGASVSGYAPVGPMEFEAGQRQYSAQEIQDMPMSEWAKQRQKFVGNNGSNNSGIFG